MKKSVLFIIAVCLIIASSIKSKHEKENEINSSEEIKVEYVTSEDEELDDATVQKNEVDIVTGENNLGSEEQDELNTDKVINNNKIESSIQNDRYNIDEDSLIGSLKFGYDNALMLHKISIAEAGIESVETMALVMLVVLNRVDSEKFPDSIYDVIHQNGQFTPVSNGSYDKAKPNEKSEKAMRLVLKGWDESQGALFFETCKGESWHSQNLDFLFQKDTTRFYK